MIQYPKQLHVTLPSVESWAINNNILKDPPKSITTRRIDKVGQNQDLVYEVDGSGDRICEGINVYARGVNPFVAVSFDNFSNNGGKSGFITNQSSRPQVSMPYKVMREGVFRPPVQNPRDLLPLSRQPRLLSEKYSNPGFINFAKSRFCPEKFRQVKEEVLKTCVRPTAVFNIEKPIEPFDINYSIVENPIKFSVNAGYKGTDRTTLSNVTPTKGANNDNNNVMAFSNFGSNEKGKRIEFNINDKKYTRDTLQGEYGTNISGHKKNVQFDIDKDRYIQDRLQGELGTNISSYTKNIEFDIDEDRYIQDRLQGEYNTNISGYTKNVEFDIDEDRYIQNRLQGEYNTNISGYTKNIEFDIDEDRYIKDAINISYTAPIKGTEIDALYHENELELERSIPQYQAQTNKSDNRVNKWMEYENELHLERNTPLTSAQTNFGQVNNPGNMNVSSRDFRLPNRLPVGGFEGKATIPQQERSYEGESLNDQRRKFNEKVFGFFEGRYLN
jgi:hypothetical protein